MLPGRRQLPRTRRGSSSSRRASGRAWKLQGRRHTGNRPARELPRCCCHVSRGHPSHIASSVTIKWR